MPHVPTPMVSRTNRGKDEPAATIVIQVDGEVIAPPTPAYLHERARSWFDGLRASAQSQRYEPSDWQQALVLAEVLSMALDPATPASQRPGLFRTFTQASAGLLVTEASRRNARVEVQRADAGVPAELRLVHDPYSA